MSHPARETGALPFAKPSLSATDGRRVAALSGLLRYFLLRHVHPFEDADFSVARLEAAYRTDLANGLGNLCNRLEAAHAPPGYHEALAEARFDRAVASLWDVVTRLNREIAETRPWEAVGDGRRQARERVTGWLAELRALAYWLEPFLPRASGVIARVVSGPVRRGAALFPRVGD